MKIICLVGGQGVGKDLILKSALQMIKELKPIISHTTRPMRLSETEGIEYHFIDIETATDMLNNDEFVETRQYFVVGQETWLYGIHKSEIDLESENNYICIVDLQGLKKIENYLKKYDRLDSLTSIYIDASYQNRLLRALNREGNMRNEQVLEVIRRFEDDRMFVEPARDYCDLTFNNDNMFDLFNIISKIRELVE